MATGADDDGAAAAGGLVASVAGAGDGRVGDSIARDGADGARPGAGVAGVAAAER